MCCLKPFSDFPLSLGKSLRLSTGPTRLFSRGGRLAGPPHVTSSPPSPRCPHSAVRTLRRPPLRSFPGRQAPPRPAGAPHADPVRPKRRPPAPGAATLCGATSGCNDSPLGTLPPLHHDYISSLSDYLSRRVHPNCTSNAACAAAVKRRWLGVTA